MGTINRELILLGRQLRKMSQTELAERAGITQGYLSKIEQGLTDSPDELLPRLSEALAVPESFLCQSDRFYGLPVSVHPMFRKKASLSATSLNAVQAELSLRIMHIRRLLQAVDLKPELALPKLDLDEYNGDIEEIARLVRASWLIPRGPIGNLVEYVERAGCVVIESDLDSAGIDGITLSIPGLPPCIFLNRNRPADRKRFTLAHELGHLVMHTIPSPDMENEANLFASCLLMPAPDIGPQLSGLSLAKMAALKPIWRVSMASILMRAKTLGRVTESQSTYLWRQMAPYRLREPDELSFADERPSVLPELLRLHLEELGYSSAELAGVLHMMPQEFDDYYPRRGRHLHLVKG